MPKSKERFTCMIVVVDYLTKWVEAEPLSDKTADSLLSSIIWFAVMVAQMFKAMTKAVNLSTKFLLTCTHLLYSRECPMRITHKPKVWLKETPGQSKRASWNFWLIQMKVRHQRIGHKLFQGCFLHSEQASRHQQDTSGPTASNPLNLGILCQPENIVMTRQELWHGGMRDPRDGPDIISPCEVIWVRLKSEGR